jgi:HEAT repeat protein
MAASSDWADRTAAVRLLGNHIGDPRARVQLVRAISDRDTAVVAAATDVLVRVGGVAGMRDVLQQLARNDDDTGYHIRDRLVEIWMHGFPVLDVVREILTDEPPGATRDGASEMLDLLEAQ